MGEGRRPPPGDAVIAWDYSERHDTASARDVASGKPAQGYPSKVVGTALNCTHAL